MQALKAVFAGMWSIFGQSPLFYVSLFYAGGAFGLVVSALLSAGILPETDLVYKPGLVLMAALSFASPSWGLMQSVWFLARGQRIGESLGAIFLALPFLIVVETSIRRALARQALE